MTKFRILISMFLIFSLAIQVESQEVLMTIGDREITLEEFERIYKKNNSTISRNQQTPEEYLELFINFKLKVIEAENRGMDTTEQFQTEFNNYKEQLAKPYLTDEETKEELLLEAYERMKYDVHVSHILLNMQAQASPEDTLKRYEQAMEIRQRIIDGEDFSTVAKATSEDPSVRNNGGDLGYFTVFRMVYPFETAAYSLEVGEVSLPVRTLHGYHIIKKHDERLSVGQARVAHIFLRTPPGQSAEQAEETKKLVMALNDSIKRGVEFGDLAMRHSEDKSSAVNGGELPWFGPGRMIPEFEKAAFALEPGQVSEPFQTFYGWHIVKMLERYRVGTFEEMKSAIQNKAFKGERDRVKRKRYLDQLKDNYEFTLNKGTYNSIHTYLDTSIFNANWKAPTELANSKEVLAETNSENIELGKFIKYLAENQRRRPQVPLENYVDMFFNKYVEEHLIEIEKSTLADRFPEYKYILQEYHDGILLFNLMDTMVWSKAVKDTVGLEAFFKQHRDDYMWDERTEAIIVSLDSTADLKGLLKKVKKIASGRWDENKLNKKFCNDTVNCIELETVIVEDGRNEHVDALNGQIGVGKPYSVGDETRFVITTNKVPPARKELNETRGQVTSDYQDYLEKEWIKELRNKYEVTINKELISQIE